MLQSKGPMTRVLALTLLCVLAACDRGFGGSETTAHTSGGEVALSDGGSLPYSITSDRYKQWDEARKGIDKRTSKRFGDLLQPASPSRRSISRATAYLESQPRARQAIESAGMTVRNFVEMTVALEQEMRLASAREESRSEPTPMPAPFPPPIDTSGIPESPVPVTPIVPPPIVDTTRRADTMPSVPAIRRDTAIPKLDTAPKRDTVIKRDSVVKKDSVIKRDSLPSAMLPPRDTVRDTLAAPAIH
jgi:hypothetical protein